MAGGAIQIGEFVLPFRLDTAEADAALRQFHKKLVDEGQNLPKLPPLPFPAPPKPGTPEDPVGFIDRLTKGMKEFKGEQVRDAKTAKYFVSEWLSFIPAGTKANDVIMGLTAGLAGGLGLGLAVEAAGIAVKWFTEYLQEEEKAAKAAAEANEKHNEALRHQNEHFDDLLDSIAKLPRGMEEMKKAQRDFNTATEKDRAALAKLNEELLRTRGNMSALSIAGTARAADPELARIRAEMAVVEARIAKQRELLDNALKRSGDVVQAEEGEAAGAAAQRAREKKAQEDERAREKRKTEEEREREQREQKELQHRQKVQQLILEAEADGLDKRGQLAAQWDAKLRELDFADTEAYVALLAGKARALARFDEEALAKKAETLGKLRDLQEAAAAEEQKAEMDRRLDLAKAEHEAFVLREANGIQDRASEILTLEEHYRKLLAMNEGNLQAQLRLQQEFATKKARILSGQAAFERFMLDQSKAATASFASSFAGEFGKVIRTSKAYERAMAEQGEQTENVADLSAAAIAAMVQDAVASIAQQALVESLKETAYGVANLAMAIFGNPAAGAAAAVHFAAAAQFAAVAGVAGLAASTIGAARGMTGAEKADVEEARKAKAEADLAAAGGSTGSGSGSGGSGGGRSTGERTDDRAGGYWHDETDAEYIARMDRLAHELNPNAPDFSTPEKLAEYFANLTPETMNDAIGAMTGRDWAEAEAFMNSPQAQRQRTWISDSPLEDLGPVDGTTIIRETVIIIGDPMETPQETARRAQRRLNLANQLDMPARSS